LHGSAVLGGWMPERSDVDMLFVTENGLCGPEVAEAAAVLAAREPGCPGRGLECSVVTAGQAARPRAPWPFLLHVAHDPGEDQVRVVDGGGQPGDTDLLMHYAVCRAAGWPVHGPAPAELIGSVPRAVILGYLADELRWGIEHAGEAYAVLNACRAQVYLANGRIVSKVTGGHIALARGLGPAAVIGRALDQQQGHAPQRGPGPDAADFVLAVAGALRGAAGD
jgi:streptomycin 3"-adenylyltransferase